MSIIFQIKSVVEPSMESVVCKICGENNLIHSSFCSKCGAEIPLGEKPPQETSLEREIITELDLLRDSPYAGRIDSLFLQLEQLPNLSAQSIKILGYFTAHSDDDVVVYAQKILEKYGIQQQYDISIQKTSYIGETYRITNQNDFIARRSSFNRLGVYFLIIVLVLACLTFFSILNLSGLQLPFTLSPFFILILLIIMINKFTDIRRITVFGPDGLPMGIIKGNLSFNRWKILDLGGETNLTLHFNFWGSDGKMETHFDSFMLKKVGECIRVFDSNNIECFGILSTDSIYERKNFLIILAKMGSKLNPFLTFSVSICIIERCFRPVKKLDSGGP